MYTNVKVPFSSGRKMHERHIELGPVVLGRRCWLHLSRSPKMQGCGGGEGGGWGMVRLVFSRGGGVMRGGGGVLNLIVGVCTTCPFVATTARC